jgi:prepilin-type N-terminal cleavage/methylation domain-containing protein
MMLRVSKAFTLIELMIVVAIIAILVAVALPKFGDMLEKSNLGATMGNLAALRSAISIYYGSNTVMPDTLDVGNLKFSENIQGEMPSVRATYPAGHSPKGNNVVIGTDVPDTMGTGWYYNHGTGWIYINSTASDLNGICYTVY